MDFDNSKHPKQPSVVPNRLGTFGGVFTPSILTILGVIMFLGAGFVIGQAGLLCPFDLVPGSSADPELGLDGF